MLDFINETQQNGTARIAFRASITMPRFLYNKMPNFRDYNTFEGAYYSFRFILSLIIEMRCPFFFSE